MRSVEARKLSSNFNAVLVLHCKSLLLFCFIVCVIYHYLLYDEISLSVSNFMIGSFLKSHISAIALKDLEMSKSNGHIPPVRNCLYMVG